MKSAAPLPDLTDLAAALAGAPADDAALAAPWRHGGETAFWFSRGAWAMAALVTGWRSAHDGAAPVLWLPDYFCNQSTAPARAAGARLLFYPIGDDLEPDRTACDRLAETAPPDIFVLVHFFGRLGGAAEARAFCQRFDCLMVEDAAHAIGPEPSIGALGDAVFYSPHKTLAVPDGGLLLVWDSGFAGAVSEAASTLGRASPSAMFWLAKRLLQKALPASPARRLIARRGPSFDDDPSFAALPATPALGSIARRLLVRQGRNLDATALARRRHGEELIEAIAGWSGVTPLFADLPRAPYRLAVRADDAPDLYGTLRRLGVPVETWPDLAPEVIASADDHGVALSLRRSVLLFPLHASLGWLRGVGL
jgi:hypothetical protein